MYSTDYRFFKKSVFYTESESRRDSILERMYADQCMYLQKTRNGEAAAVGYLTQRSDIREISWTFWVVCTENVGLRQEDNCVQESALFSPTSSIVFMAENRTSKLPTADKRFVCKNSEPLETCGL